MGVAHLEAARIRQDDEFYTQKDDVYKALSFLEPYLVNQKIILPADNLSSNFWLYFVDNYHHLKLKKLVAFSIHPTPTKYEYDGVNLKTTHLQHYCILNALDDSNYQDYIYITNPPFSTLKIQLKKLYDNHLKFVFVIPISASGYKYTCKGFFEQKYWLLPFRIKNFIRPDKSLKANSCFWLTNLVVLENRPVKRIKGQDIAWIDPFSMVAIYDSSHYAFNSDYFMVGAPVSALQYYDNKVWNVWKCVSPDNGSFKRVVFYKKWCTIDI